MVLINQTLARRWSFLGSLIGIAGAILLTRFLESQLFEVTPTDPLTFGAGRWLPD